MSKRIPFISAANFVIDRLEGGAQYTNDPADSGGETKWGISKRSNPDVDIANLDRDGAIKIYFERYWRPSQADRFPAGIALAYYAAYVNMSPRAAIGCLQRACNVKDDGQLGPVTIAGVVDFRPQSELRARFARECVMYYVQLAENRPVYRRFRYGWVGRVCRVTDEAGRWGD